MGLEVRSVYEYQNELRLFSHVESLIAKEEWGMAADTLRISLIEHLGGAYADLNFNFNRDITDEVHKYNFFTMANVDYYILQSFFAASAHHPVLNKALNLIERNFNAEPGYISSLAHILKEYTFVMTANPLSIAYYSEANTNGNIDAIYPMVNQNLENYQYLTQLSQELAIEESMVKDKCIELSPLINLKIYINNHDICISELFDIGEDINAASWL
jgi:hypothetical protein